MLGIPWNVWASIGLGLTLAVYVFWPGIKAAWSNLPSGGGTPAVANEDGDMADFKALRRLRARYERMKCPEGLAACDECLRHFDHKGPA